MDASRSGLLLEVDGSLLAPQGGLPSVTRAAYLTELGAASEARDLTPALLRSASAIWLCGSGLGICPVASVSAPDWRHNYAVRPARTRHPGLRLL